jgi:hypothetical protein
VIVYAIRAGAFVDSQSLSQVARSSLPLAARPRERWKAAIAFLAFSPVLPSMMPGDISSQSRSTSALKVAALVIRREVASEHAT